MALYFFHTIDGHAVIDSEGTDLPNMAAVKREAISTAASILSDTTARELASSSWRMTVVDETGKVVYRLYFSSRDYP